MESFQKGGTDQDAGDDPLVDVNYAPLFWLSMHSLVRSRTMLGQQRWQSSM